MNQYKLLDCGNQKKVELFGKYKLIRPCPQAMWKPFDDGAWGGVDAEFERTGSEKGVWKQNARKLPKSWQVESKNGLLWNIEPNEFGNLGVFTEHWIYAPDLPEFFNPKGKILNVFTYTGSNCLDLISKGYNLTVLDSSRNAMNGFTKNLELNSIGRDKTRLILEDSFKFMAREVRRGNKYDGLMIDAPSYGRGTKGEIFSIEKDILKLLKTTKDLLKQDGKLILTLHSPRFTPIILEVLVSQIFADKIVEVEEIVNQCESGVKLPSGFLVKVA